MPETKTSQSHEPSQNQPPMDLTKESATDETRKHSPSNEVHWLIVEDDKGRRDIPLGGEIYSMGRDPNTDIRLFSMFVSRRHATLVRREREDGIYDYQIVDGDLDGNLSANGILINNRKLHNHLLKNKDKILFAGGVSAKYYRVKRDERSADSKDTDPFDITLIDPGMIDED